MSESTTLHVFYGRLLSFKYLYKSGVEAIFQQDLLDPSVSVYRTGDDDRAKELMEEITLHKNPYIFQRKGQETIQSDMVDPVEAYKRKIIEEYEAKRAAEVASGQADMGTSAPAPLMPASSHTLGELITGSANPSPLGGAALKMLSVAGLKKG
jgi:hypothetical protein